MPFLRNAIPDFLNYWKVVSAGPDALKLARWNQLYAAKHEPYMTFYSQQFSPDFVSAFHRYPRIVGRIGEIGQDVEAVLGEIETKLQALFDPEIRLNVFLFVGGFGPSAFVAHLKDDPWLWLASERLCEYPVGSLRAKVAHEAVHTAHLRMLRKAHPSLKLEKYERALAYHLFSEGLAAVSTKMVFADLEDPVYMLLEDGEGELNWCIENEERLIQMMSGMLEAEDQMARSMWFGSKRHESVPYKGTGFYIAAVAFQELLESGKATLRDLALIHPKEHISMSLQALRQRSLRIRGK